MIIILIQFYSFIDKKRLNPSIDFKRPVAVSSHKNKKVIDQLKHDRRFQTKRRNVISEAEKQLEAALLALQYHNAQRGLSEKTFESSEFQENPYQAKESGSFNDNAYQRKRQLNPQRIKPQEYMSKAQQQEIIGRIISQNSPELQQRFPYGDRKDNSKHFFKQQKPPVQPLIAIAGSRVDLGQDSRAPDQKARQRQMSQFRHLKNGPGFYNSVSSQQNIPETIEDQNISPTSEDRELPYQYLKHQQSDQRLNLKNNFQVGPKSMLNMDRSHPDDQISMMIAECLRNTQCSSHAKCITQPGKQGFCRCLPNYRGNGISCWELSLELVP